MRQNSPTQDGRFLLLDGVGHGSSASVMRAYDRVHQRLVALKLLRRSFGRGARHPAAAEFAAGCRVRHAGVVDLYELGRARRGPLPEGQPYIVMQWIDGLPIDQAIRPGSATNEQLHEVAVQALLALASVHDAGLVHRDVSPANLLASLDPRGGVRLMLTDFGLAVPIGHRSRPGIVSGTFRQLAPETFLGTALDGRVDLYALGLVLAFLASGTHPCPSSPARAVAWHLAKARLELGRRDLTRSMVRLISRLTQSDRKSRPGTAREALLTLGLSRDEVVGAAAARPLADQAELGGLQSYGRRIVHLPVDPDARDRTIRAVRVWAETRGIAFHHWTDDRDGLRRLALRLALLDLGRARERIVRFRLDRAIGLGWVGDVPMLFTAPPRSQSLAAARRIAHYILECARSGTLVLALEPAAGEIGRALVREAIRRLDRAPGAGDYLIFVDPVTDRRSRSPSP